MFGSILLHCLYSSCMCNTTLCLTYFLFGYEIRLFGGLWCLHFHFVPFLSILYSVLYALIIRTKSRRAYTSLHSYGIHVKKCSGVIVFFNDVYVCNLGEWMVIQETVMKQKIRSNNVIQPFHS